MGCFEMSRSSRIMIVQDWKICGFKELFMENDEKMGDLLIFNRLFRGQVYANILEEGYPLRLKSLMIESLAVFLHVRRRTHSRLCGDVGMRMDTSGDAPAGRLHFLSGTMI
jgi:hypothetical protein